MRKRILSLALMISILSSLFIAFPIATNATENTESTMPVSIKSVYCYYADNKVTAEVDFASVNEDCIVILAVYNEGKFVNVKREVLLAEELEKNIVISDVYENCIGYEAKVLCWGRADELTPLTTPFSVQITEYETEIVRRLKAVSSEIALFFDRDNPDLYTYFNQAEKYILREIKKCIDDAVANHADELDAEFIKTQYETQINDVHGVYDGMTQDDQEKFKGKMTKFDTANLIWLADTLGIDLSQFGIDPSDYLK